jgi:hypothetical protein
MALSSQIKRPSPRLTPQHEVTTMADQYLRQVTLLSIGSTNGTLAMTQRPKVVNQILYAESGTMFVLGSSLAAAGITTSFGIPLAAGTPFEIKGPAAFLLLCTTGTGSVKLVESLSATSRGSSGTILA